MKRLVGGIVLSMSLMACERDINFDLKNAENVLVVDAVIENDQPPVVVLTRSSNFFSSIDTALLRNLFVHDAIISISNGRLTHQLKEYTYPVGLGINTYAYSIDSSNLATAFVGEFNTAYSMTIQSEGKTYHTQTTVPILAKKPDSLWWLPAPFVEDTTKVILMVKATDPPGLGNYVRYFTKTNSEPFYPGENSVFDDQVIDGSTYSLRVDPGVDRNFTVPYDSNYFRRGDTITMKLANIDKPAYTFWSTWEFAYQSIGNPFALPNKVLGNVDNGALGAFYGYASSSKTIIVPR